MGGTQTPCMGGLVALCAGALVCTGASSRGWNKKRWGVSRPIEPVFSLVKGVSVSIGKGCCLRLGEEHSEVLVTAFTAHYVSVRGTVHPTPTWRTGIHDSVIHAENKSETVLLS